MKPWLDDGDLRLYHGDVLTVLRDLPSGIAQTCITSPPYWGLRDYGTGTWNGGDADCDHIHQKGGRNPETAGKQLTNTGTIETQYADVCGKCGAERVDDQLGLEATPDAYIQRMVEVFREVRRVLRDDGTLWLNIGDSYNSHGTQGATGANSMSENGQRFINNGRAPGLKHKDLVGIPWRLAFALQTDGWYLRSDIIWAKPNPMPESVTDRPTKAHEYVFLFSKQPRYFYDADAVREAPVAPERATDPYPVERHKNGRGSIGVPGGYIAPPSAGRNQRSVWQIATQPFPEAHFATYPEELVRRCIQAGTSEKGGCAECGAPRRRIVDRARLLDGSEPVEGGWEQDAAGRIGANGVGHWRVTSEASTIGWEPSCVGHFGEDSIPQLVLDPFIGSGTTALVARKHGRHSIGIDLSEEYLEIAAQRTRQLSLLGGC